MAERREGIKEEGSGLHYLMVVDPDIELSPYHIDVRGRVPVGAGVRGIRIAKSDVDAGDLLVLQNIADHVPHRDIGADCEFTNAIAVFIGVAVVSRTPFRSSLFTQVALERSRLSPNIDRQGRVPAGRHTSRTDNLRPRHR